MRAGKTVRHILASGVIAGSMIAVGLSAATASAAVTPKVEAKSITFAEAPGAAPNWIWPYDSCKYFSVDNINQFQELMYRPLYWFGLGNSVAEQPALSIGGAPQELSGGKVWKITLKSYKFNGGGTTTAASAKFFLDLYKADPAGAHAAGGGYCGYNPGYGIPDLLKSVTASGQVLTLTFNIAIANKQWMIYNNFSQITPFPATWDTTAGKKCENGAYNAAATNTACVAVEKHLLAAAATPAHYSDSFWQSGTDGPWKLTSFNALGDAKFVPNAVYSGPQKAKVATFYEKYYASDAAEEAALGAKSVQLGFLDPTFLPCCSTSPGKPGPQLPFVAANYRITGGTGWSFNYALVNFNSGGSAMIKQLYVRKALVMGDDQAAIIHSVDKGYGIQEWSPLPYGLPSSLGHQPANPYPFSITTGRNILLNNGWSNIGGGPALQCTSPGPGAGNCGTGTTLDEPLTLNVHDLSAATCESCANTMNAEIQAWTQEGFNVSQTSDTFDNTIVYCAFTPASVFDICSWGGGWLYAPDYEPTGESLFATNAGSNYGGYTDPTMDSLIHSTIYGTANLDNYAQYAAQQIPVIYQANPTGSGEVEKSLKGVPAPNPLADLMPEYMYY